MKFLAALLLTAVLNYLAGLIFPWWIIAVCGFVVALFIVQPPLKAFLSGLIGGFVTWFLLAFFIDRSNEHILAGRISALFGLTGYLPLIIITGVIGGLVTALSAASGSVIRQSPRKKP